MFKRKKRKKKINASENNKSIKLASIILFITGDKKKSNNDK